MMASLSALAYGAAALVALAAVIVVWAGQHLQRPMLPAPKRVLLVIAHPDDESMFFAPTLLALQRQGVELFLACLSNGGAAGLGKVRAKELVAACAELKIPSQHVWLVDDPQLQDGMRTKWPAAVVADFTEQALKRFKCDTVLTFDRRGVSGHPNHVAVHLGVRQLMQEQGRQLGCSSAYTLVTESLLRKYSGWLDVPLSWALCGQRRALYMSPNVLQSVTAMQAHSSQWVWFRKLFVAFSSYTFINTLEPLDT